VVVWPGVVKPGTTTDAMIQSMDFYPTLVAAAHAKLPEGQIMDGQSFLPVLEGKATSFREEIFGFQPHFIPSNGQIPAVSLRRGDWKLVRDFYDGPGQTHRYELYNLADDEGETKDQSAAHPEVVKELDKRITAILQETHAVLPAPNPNYSEQAAPKKP
jgi:arylsulfatase A-like enzyme